MNIVHWHWSSRNAMISWNRLSLFLHLLFIIIHTLFFIKNALLAFFLFRFTFSASFLIKFTLFLNRQFLIRIFFITNWLGSVQLRVCLFGLWLLQGNLLVLGKLIISIFINSTLKFKTMLNKFVNFFLRDSVLFISALIILFKILINLFLVLLVLNQLHNLSILRIQNWFFLITLLYAYRKRKLLHRIHRKHRIPLNLISVFIVVSWTKNPLLSRYTNCIFNLYTRAINTLVIIVTNQKTSLRFHSIINYLFAVGLA